jgi:hypothetical protein
MIVLNSLLLYIEYDKSLRIVVYVAAAYARDSRTIGFIFTILGTGGGFTYTVSGDEISTKDSADFKYKCKCIK